MSAVAVSNTSVSIICSIIGSGQAQIKEKIKATRKAKNVSIWWRHHERWTKQDAEIVTSHFLRALLLTFMVVS